MREGGLSYGIFDAHQDVRDFHRASEVPLRAAPAKPSSVELTFRWDLIDEEVNAELRPAMRSLEFAVGNEATIKDLARVGDAIADSIYVLLGTAATFGLPMAEIWRRVHESNMAKVKDGVVRREDGKVMKPEGWKAPDVEGAIRDAMETK